MKKILMIAVLASAALGASSVKAGDLKLNFDGAGSESFAVSLPEVSLPQAVPSRTFAVRFDLQDVTKMDKVLDKTIAYAETRNSAEVVAGLKCLRHNGTPTQKAAFVYGPGVYSLPDSCQAPIAQNKGIIGDIVHCVERTVCEMITETVIKWACDTEGNCMNQPVEVLRQTCHKVCE